MATEEKFPPAHWGRDRLIAEYGKAAANYKQIMTVTPEQNDATFRNADRLLEDAQDIRQALSDEYGYEIPGVLLP